MHSNKYRIPSPFGLQSSQTNTQPVLRTDLMIQASESCNNNFTLFPLVTTTFVQANGTSTSSSHRITEGHINRFNSVRIEILSNDNTITAPTIVLNYHPLKTILISLTTPQ
jgi:hypothetical protein